MPRYECNISLKSRSDNKNSRFFFIFVGRKKKYWKMKYISYLLKHKNRLAKECCGIEDYQLLFPIPNSEVYLSNNMSQNEGYN